MKADEAVKQIAADLKDAQEKSRELTESHDKTDTTWAIAIPKTRIHTLEQLVEYCEIDLKIWKVERFVANKWEFGMKPPAKTAWVDT